jgi:hypothetical protein
MELAGRLRQLTAAELAPVVWLEMVLGNSPLPSLLVVVRCTHPALPL